MRRLLSAIIAGTVLFSAAHGKVSAQPVAASTSRALRWRSIGPFRGGRTVAISGVPGKQNVFYMAPTDGGV